MDYLSFVQIPRTSSHGRYAEASDVLMFFADYEGHGFSWFWVRNYMFGLQSKT